MTLGQKLKKARLDRGLTQAQVVGDRITRNMLSPVSYTHLTLPTNSLV